MERKLDHEQVKAATRRAGLTLTRLAQMVGVSTQSVSKWLKGEANPRPGKAIKLGRILGLSYQQMFGPRDTSSEPQVAFRIIHHQIPSEEHQERAREMGRMYESLAPYLPFSPFEAPPRLKAPSVDYAYIDGLCTFLRREMGLEADVPVTLPELFRHLSERLQAVVIPVYWGHRRDKAELAAHIYSPKTKTTWIPLNLDTQLCDARFWIAHELAHVYTFELLPETESEAFADAFAGTLVFPVSVAQCAYDELIKARVKSKRCTVITEYAQRMHISPVCVAKQVDRFASAKGFAPVHAEATSLDPKELKNIKNGKTLGEEFFAEHQPSVSRLLEVTEGVFKSPFFTTLSKFLKANGGSPAFIQGLLDCSLTDAQALNSELA